MKSLISRVQSFILTFLAEWGDRSQIATIAVIPLEKVHFAFTTIMLIGPHG